MNKNKWVAAYNDIVKHLYETMDDALHTLGEALEISTEKAGKTSDLSKEELDKVSGYVKRDVESAARDLTAEQNDKELGEWFKFDIELIENFALDAFLSVADKTRIQLAEIEERAKAHKYQSGEITIPGTFICDSCGKEIAFKTTSEIPVCPVCHATTFVRM
jgi:rubrerythrin